MKIKKSKFRILDSRYVPQGQLEDIPMLFIDKMLYNQLLQGNRPNAAVFAKDKLAKQWEGGFDWSDSKEGYHFWDLVINLGIYDLDEIEKVLVHFQD